MQPGLGLLFDHGGRFDGAEGGLGLLLGGVREGVDVVEDVGGFIDGEGGSGSWRLAFVILVGEKKGGGGSHTAFAGTCRIAVCYGRSGHAVGVVKSRTRNRVTACSIGKSAVHGFSFPWSSST